MILAVRARAHVVLIDLPLPVHDISPQGIPADLDSGGGYRAAVLAVAALGWVEAMGAGGAGHERKDEDRAHYRQM